MIQKFYSVIWSTEMPTNVPENICRKIDNKTFCGSQNQKTSHMSIKNKN